MAQLWVNLPAKDKMTPPQYQTITSAMIPEVTLDNNAGRVRVIAGTCAGIRGPAHTFTELNVWDVRLNSGATCLLDLPEGHNTILAVLQGQVQIGSGQNLGDAALAVLSATGSGVWLRAQTDVTLLALSGQPIDEPIVGYGPFVMNTRSEIVAAFNDLETGRFGRLQSGEEYGGSFKCSGWARIRGAHQVRGGYPGLRSRGLDSERHRRRVLSRRRRMVHATEIQG